MKACQNYTTGNPSFLSQLIIMTNLILSLENWYSRKYLFGGKKKKHKFQAKTLFFILRQKLFSWAEFVCSRRVLFALKMPNSYTKLHADCTPGLWRQFEYHTKKALVLLFVKRIGFVFVCITQRSLISTVIYLPKTKQKDQD